MSTREMLPGVTLCSPFEQGDLVGLCGLYAAINAIAVVLAPVTLMGRRPVRKLFNFGVTHLYEKGLLYGSIVEGMEEKDQLDLLQAMAREAETLTGNSLVVLLDARKLERSGRKRVLEAVDTGLAEGAAVLVHLEGAVTHYSVIVGCDDRRFHLMDSDCMSWIARKSVGSTRSKCRYRISSAVLVQVATLR